MHVAWGSDYAPTNVTTVQTAEIFFLLCESLSFTESKILLEYLLIIKKCKWVATALRPWKQVGDFCSFRYQRRQFFSSVKKN